MKIVELVEKESKKDSKTPNGTYAAVKFSEKSNKMLKKFAKANNIPNMLNTNDFHCTVTYSRKHIPKYDALNEINPSWEAKPIGFEVWKSNPNAYKNETTYCLVLKLKCKELVDRFNFVMDNYDATYDFDEYNPHVTLSYDVGKDFDTSDLPLPDDIEIVSEYKEGLRLEGSDD